MEPVLVAMAAGVAAFIGMPAALAVTAYRRQRQLRAWSQAAARNGLTDEAASAGTLSQAPWLAGRVGPLRVRLDLPRRGENGAKILITGLGQDAGGLTIRREGVVTAYEKQVLHGTDVEIGDPEFDGDFCVETSAPLAFAVLGPEARPRLAALLQGRVRIEGGPEVAVHASLSRGALEVRLREGRSSRTRAHLTAILAEVLDVARALAPSDVARRIAENVGHEEKAAVRLRALRVLAREYPNHPVTRPTLLAACRDGSGEVRLQAAIALGAEGRPTLLTLVADRGTADVVAAKAVSALGETLPVDLAEAVLSGALGDLGEATRHPILAAPGRSETALTCLEALGRLGRVETEGLLIAALRSPGPEVKVAAARALGRVGTVAAVAALREEMELHGDLLRSAGRQAIAQIQSRLLGAAPGQLSLAEREAGALSLAEAERGHLSLTDSGETGSPSEEAVVDAKPRGPESG